MNRPGNQIYTMYSAAYEWLGSVALVVIGVGLGIMNVLRKWIF